MSSKASPAKFFVKATAKHGDKYDYSETVYVNKVTKILYKCPRHGDVEQYPYRHLKCGCPHCAGRGVGKHTKETFIKRAREVHGDFYDYSKVDLVNGIYTKVTIICPNHGEFIQSATNHINIKNGCPKCKGGVAYNVQTFEKLATETHGGKFTYHGDYTKAHDKIKITCKKHGDFEQAAYTHLKSDLACPGCVGEMSQSRGEREIADFIKTKHSGEIQTNQRLLDYKEIDIYLPELKLGVEYHGMYWHTESVVGKKLHFQKAEIADKLGIRLIQIYENEWENKQDIVKSRLSGYLRTNAVIYARQTVSKELSFEEKNNFLNINHLQGSDNSKLAYGLYHDGELVACMTLVPNKQYGYELKRYCSRLGVNIVGGASKLLKCFDVKSIMSYADRRYSIGGLYEKIGFKLDGITSPGYGYYNIKNKQFFNRMKFQKHKLVKMEGYSTDLPEYEIMKLNGYDRIWDAGHLRYIKTI